MYRDVEIAGGTLQIRSPVHARTRGQLRSEHYDFIRRMPLYVELPEHRAIVVHAGMYPGRKIWEQTQHHLLHAVMLAPYRSDGSSSNEERSLWPGQSLPEGELEWKLWTHFWTGPELIVFGHLYTDVPLVSEHAIGLDGGCCFGGALRALILPDMRIVTVNSQNQQSAATHVRKSTGQLIRTFEVHPGVHAFS